MPRLEIPLEQLTENLSQLIYGVYGSGKTHLAGTAEDNLFLDFENGYATLANLPEFKGKVYHLENAAELKDVLTILESVRIEKEFGFRPKTIVIDTLSRLQEHEGIEILDGRKVLPGPGMEDTMEMKDWGILLTRMFRIMKLLPNRGFDVIALCQAREFENPVDKRHYWYPNLRGQWGDQIGAYFSIVSFLELKPQEPSDEEIKALGKTGAFAKYKGQMVRRLHLKQTGSFIAKSRIGNVPAYLDNPTFPQLKKIVVEGRGAKKEGGEKLER